MSDVSVGEMVGEGIGTAVGDVSVKLSAGLLKIVGGAIGCVAEIVGGN